MSETKVQAPAQTEQKPTETAPAARQGNVWQPLASFRDEIDRVFDNFWRGFGMSWERPSRRIGGEPQPFWQVQPAMGAAAPAIDLVESETEYRITAELPGMDARDMELTVTDDVLTIKGEKKQEREQKTGTYCLSERRFGSFQRSFQLPRGIDRERIDASFDKGVLVVTLPKTAEAAQRQKKIEVRQAS